MRRAVIDVGSNSLLLVVAEKSNDDWKTLFESSEVTGLGSDVKQTGNLSSDGMATSLDALKRAFDKSKEFGADVRAFGTMALRIANNAAAFQDCAKSQSTPVEIITGEQEAQLGLLSVLEDPFFKSNERITIIDVGGQSTEIATAAKDNGSWKESFRKSYPIGTLALRSGALNEESPSQSDILKASQEIDDTFGMRYLKGETGTVVALGATATNLVTIRDALAEWQPDKVHGALLEFEEISRFVAASFRMNDAQRASLKGIEKGRGKTIHIGALILERALQAVCALECLVSVRGWRHAMLDRF